MRIAWFTPFAKASGIGKYGAVFIRELVKEHAVTVFADGVDSEQDVWLNDIPLHLLKQMQTSEVVNMLPDFDAVFYNMGDSAPYHSRIYDIARSYPGVVILHDLVMHHFFFNYYLSDLRDPDSFLQELTYSHGTEGKALGDEILSGTSGDIWTTSKMLEFNMALSAIRGAHGVVTHSPYSEQILRSISPAPTAYVPFPTPPLEARAEAKLQRGSKRVQLLSFGVVNPNKQIDRVIETIGRSRILRSRVSYTVIGSGEAAYMDHLKGLIEQHGLRRQVQLLGYQSDDVLHQAIAEADLILNIRNPHFGESSASLVEGMAMGKPVVVWNHGYYATFPDDTVIKVDSDESLQQALERLSQDREQCRAYGRAAKSYIQQHLVTAESARQLVAFAEAVRREKLVLNVTDFVIGQLQEMGADERFPHLHQTVIQVLGEFIT